MEKTISQILPKSSHISYASVAASNVPSSSSKISNKSSTLTHDPKPLHKLIIKSKTPSLSAKSIVTKSIHPTKDQLNLTFNKESRNGSLTVDSETLADIQKIKEKLEPASNLKLIEPRKHNPQIIIHSLPTEITNEDIQKAITISSYSKFSLNPPNSPLSSEDLAISLYFDNTQSLPNEDPSPLFTIWSF